MLVDLFFSHENLRYACTGGNTMYEAELMCTRKNHIFTHTTNTQMPCMTMRHEEFIIFFFNIYLYYIYIMHVPAVSTFIYTRKNHIFTHASNTQMACRCRQEFINVTRGMVVFMIAIKPGLIDNCRTIPDIARLFNCCNSDDPNFVILDFYTVKTDILEY